MTSDDEGKARTVKKSFSRETSVAISIGASADTVWRILTNAADYPAWTATVRSIDGEIALGRRIVLRSALDEKRSFRLTVLEALPPKRLVWGDGQGKRVFTLTPQGPNNVRFTMTERIGGALFPLYGRFIPSFDESFERFSADLKGAAETTILPESGTP
ncbi:MAG: SRPBCC domain-containing protein [Gemmatimonadota bacterium]